MAIYLRKASKNRWHPREEYKDCEEGDTPLDPLTDLKTQNNKLSVWKIEDVETDEESEVNGSPLFRRIIAALAARIDVSDIVYILISDSTLEDLGIEPQKIDGETPDTEANEKWHYDLHISSVQRLVKLADTMIGKPRTVLKHNTKKYLQESIDSEWLEANRCIKIALGIIKIGDCPKCGKPLGNCSNCEKPIQIK